MSVDYPLGWVKNRNILPNANEIVTDYFLVTVYLDVSTLLGFTEA